MPLWIIVVFIYFWLLASPRSDPPHPFMRRLAPFTLQKSWQGLPPGPEGELVGPPTYSDFLGAHQWTQFPPPFMQILSSYFAMPSPYLGTSGPFASFSQHDLALP